MSEYIGIIALEREMKKSIEVCTDVWVSNYKYL